MIAQVFLNRHNFMTLFRGHQSLSAKFADSKHGHVVKLSNKI